MNEGGKDYSILYFLDYGKKFGGAAQTLLQQAVLMKGFGYRTAIFFSNYLGADMSNEYREICLESGIEWEWETYQISSQTEDIDIICINRNYERLKDKIIAFNPDILHSVQLNPCVELISRELKIPHIMNIYPLTPEFFSVDYINIFPHYHICDSWYYAKKWKHFLKTDSTCIRTMAESNYKENKSLSNRLLNYICVGSIYEGKNQLMVIKAFHKALKNGLKGNLTLYGYAGSHYAENCMRYIKNNKIENCVFIKGFCSKMKKVYETSDVLLCGSLRESYPNAVSEAMGHNLVIISTPVAGIPEVIKDGINGYLTKGYTVQALYEKIMEFQKDLLVGKTKKILENTEKSFRKYHSPQVVREQLIVYYQHVLNDYSPNNNSTEMKKVEISDIRIVFREWTQRFNKNEKYFYDSQKVALKLWYLYHIEKDIIAAFHRKSKFYIWGAGKYGMVVKEMIEVFLPEIHIKGFIDSKRKGNFGEYTIYHPEDILEKNNIVVFIAAVKGQHEIKNKLEERKMVYNKDYFILAARSW